MNRWMKIAYNEAMEGMHADDGGPFGAVIVQGEKVIAAAHNEVLKTNDPTAHAEINAIRKASEQLVCYDLSDCVLYTTSKPCPMCLGAIFWARIGTVYYGATEQDAARGGFDDHRFYEMMRGQNNDIVFKQIDYEANAGLIDQWLEKEDRQMY
ncbi:MAG: nucleoside deaminase [Campylobacterota bacterium]|nr:nucleoside deaminase [Campylobacterota bacterium]